MTRPRTFHKSASRRRKALGQHFLANLRAADAIVDAFSPAAGEPVLEVGPGRGVLTERLLARGAVVAAIEKDERLAATLRERLAAHAGFHLHVGDALRADLGEILRPLLEAAAGRRARVLANLPYSVASKILARLFADAALFSSFTLLLQREVVDRICSPPGRREYGSLSVLAQYFARPRLLMHLSPGSFRPVPRVESALVHLPLREDRELGAEDESAYPRFIRRLFLSRRRTLPHNLKGMLGRDARAIARSLDEIGIDAGRRPETLVREECLRIFLAARREGGRPASAGAH